MASYGTIIKPTPTFRPSGGAPSRGGGSIGFVRTLLTAVEVGVAFLSGGLSVPAETAISLAFGVANEMLDIKSRNVNVQNTILNIGLPFVSGYLTRLSNAKKIQDTLTGKGLILDTDEVFFGPFGENVVWSKGEIDTFLEMNTLEIMYNRGGLPTKISSPKEISSFMKEFQALMESSTTDATGRSFLIRSGKDLDAVIRSGDIAVDTATEDIRADINADKRISKQKINRLAKYIANSRIREDEVTKNIIKTLYKVRNKPRLYGEFREIFDELVNHLKKTRTNKAETKLIKKLAREEMANGREFNMSSAYLGTWKSKIAVQKEERWSFWRSVRQKGLIKTLGSRQFNDKIVQHVQMIDPHDLGRAPVERAYQWLVKLIKGRLGTNLKWLKRMQSAEEAFVKGGGIALNSTWLLGYRVIKSIGTNHFIQISFQAGPSFGKPPVYVWASDPQMVRLIDSPGTTYLRYWSLSRGGKKLSSFNMLKAAGMFNVVSGISGAGAAFTKIEGQWFHSFMNIQALKNVFSLVSNIVENGHDMMTGDYSKNYLSKLKKSFIGTTISRAFRLGGRSTGWFIGGRLGEFIGRELQRVGTQVIAFSIKWRMNGKKGNFWKALRRQAAKAAITSVRSNVLRAARRKNPRSVLIKSLSLKRKAKVITRFPNTVMPGRPYNGIRLIKRKRR